MPHCLLETIPLCVPPQSYNGAVRRAENILISDGQWVKDFRFERVPIKINSDSRSFLSTGFLPTLPECRFTSVSQLYLLKSTWINF